MNDNLENKIKEEKSRRSFLKKSLLTLGSIALAGYIGITAACSSPTTPPPPPPPDKVKVYVTTTANYTLAGTPASGTVDYLQSGTTTPTTKNLGEQAYLGEIAKNTTMDVDITINVNGALKRVFKNVGLSGTKTLATDVLELQNFDITDFTQYFLEQCGNRNMVWDQPAVKVYFNPDPSTGDRLPTDFITATEAAVNEIALYSKGFINSVSFDENGNKPDDATVPPNGEIWVYNTTRLIGVTNGVYPVGGDVVKASKLWYNVSSSTPSQVRKEVMDAFIQNNQNVFLDAYLAKWFEFALKHRPKGNAYNYFVYNDHEEESGFNGTMTAGATVYSESSDTTFMDKVTGGSRYSSPDYSAPGMSGKVGAQKDKAATEKGKIRN